MTKKPIAVLHPMIEREITDENFAHCISLLPFTTMWAESLDGKKRPDDPYEVRNMIFIPCEVLWAFVKRHAQDDGPLGDACKKATAELDNLRQTFGRHKDGSAA